MSCKQTITIKITITITIMLTIRITIIVTITITLKLTITKTIREHNKLFHANKTTFRLGVNTNADMTAKEFAARY